MPIRKESLFVIVTLFLAGQAVAKDQAGVLPIETDRIKLSAPILFDSKKPRILPESHKVLDTVAATIETHLDIAKLEIGVHTDSRGSAAYIPGHKAMKYSNGYRLSSFGQVIELTVEVVRD